MPGGDRTGPLGLGPATGRGAGYCRSYGMPGYANRWAGGWGRGRGGGWWGGGRGGGFGGGGYGRGWHHRYSATGIPGWAWNWEGTGVAPLAGGPISRETHNQERRRLEEEAEFLRGELEEINRRLTELKTDKEA
jgi:hypothetical protein